MKKFLIAQIAKNLPAMQETRVQSLGWEDPLEKGKATHSRFCLENSMDRPWGHKESDVLEQLYYQVPLSNWWPSLGEVGLQYSQLLRLSSPPPHLFP